MKKDVTHFKRCLNLLWIYKLQTVLFMLLLFSFNQNLIAQDCCDQGDKPIALTFTYIGGGCPGNNSQGNKADCSGGVVNSSSVFISAGEDAIFSGTVNLGESFTVVAEDDKFKSNTEISVGSQLLEIHTSCSAPIVIGDVFGALRLDFVEFKNGVDCGPPPPPECDNVTDGGSITGDEVNCDPFNPNMIMNVEEASGNSNLGGGGGGNNGGDCCDQGDKPIELTFTYIGGGCPGNNSQGSKSDCSGGNVNSGSIFIEATEKEDGSGDTYFSGNVSLGSSFTFDPNGDKFPSKMFISVGNQTNEIHTSCSAPLVTGETFGALRLDFIEFKNGVDCGLPPPAPVNYQWIQSTAGCPNNVNQAIPGATGLTYNPPFITQTTWYVRLARRDFCESNSVGATEGWIASNCVIKEIEDCDPCIGQGGDTDGDGICNPVDCQPFNPAFPATPGTPCNDGNPNTTNDLVQGDGCSCAGTPTCSIPATFNVPDGCLDDSFLIFADANDPYFPPNNPNFSYSYDVQPANTIGGIFTIDPRSVTVTFNAPGQKFVTATITDPDIPGCQVVLTTTFIVDVCDPCVGQGGDTDGDGICNPVDCQPFNPAFPAPPGTPCNDGNPNTVNDVVQSDGCSCAGTPTGGGNCDDVVCTGSTGKLTITGLTGAIVQIQIFDTGNNWTTVFNCAGDCNTPTQMVNLPTGNYFVKVNFYTASWQPVCEKTSTCSVPPGGDPCDNQGGDSDGDGVCNNQDCKPYNPAFPTTPGTPCNDGNPNTSNDVVQSDGCSCAGTPVNPCNNQGGDTDGDGVCNNVDCQPFNPAFPTTPGTPCNDGNPNTNNDVVQSDGCSCAGTPIGGGNCDNVQITAGNGVIIISGLNATPVSQVQVFNASWNTVFTCAGNCNATEQIAVGAGTYHVKVNLYTGGWSPICEKFVTITVGGNCDNITNGGVIAGDESRFGGYDPAPITNVQSPSGGSGQIEYLWLSSTTGCPADLSLAIPGATGPTYDPPFINKTTYFVRCSRRAGCMGPATWIESNCIVKTVTSSGGGNPCNISVSGGNGSLTISGVTSPHHSVKVFSPSWNMVFQCNDNCSNPIVVHGLPGGTYYVDIQLWDAQWQPMCNVPGEYVNVSSGLISQDAEYLFLQAEKDGQAVNLNWVTNTDYKNDYFIVERSKDGINFEVIDEVLSNSNSIDAVAYQYVDEYPTQGRNTYRITEVFEDGDKMLSEIRMVDFEVDPSAIIVYPNPTSGNANIILKDFAGESANIQVVNMLGQIISEMELDEIPDSPVFIDLNQARTGVYMISIKIGDQKRITKMLTKVRL